MEFLTELLENSSLPFLSAIILGLMTALSPCPLATNVTAVGYISRDLTSRHKVFINGLIYTLGRAVSYTLLAVLIFLGADQFNVSGFFQQYGERILGPLLIIVGILMLGVVRFNLPGFGFLTSRLERKGVKSYLDVLLLGLLFALAFCPYSGVLYFGMLIPMTISNATGLYLPVVFAIATGIPVIVFAWLLAYTISGVGIMYRKIQSFEFWFRRIVAIIFILVGMYYVNAIWL
jgi:sulfite exporter TauE/SafE